MARGLTWLHAGLDGVGVKKDAALPCLGAASSFSVVPRGRRKKALVKELSPSSLYVSLGCSPPVK